ncbi:WYL domain-containing protein [Fredinandcohnia humi]
MQEQTNIKKRQEILRSFFVYNGVHDLNYLMEMLGVSESTYYKTLREMIDLLYNDEISGASQLSNRQAIHNRVKYDPYHSMQNFLGRLYQAEKIEDKATVRYGLLLKLLDYYGELSTSELEKRLGSHYLKRNDFDKALLDKRGIRRYTDVLLTEGMISNTNRKEGKTIKSFFELNHFFDHFKEDELLDLYAFITYCTYAEIPAAPGFLLLEKLKKHMVERTFIDPEKLDHTIYQYPYCGRVLDEYMCYELFPMVEKGRSVTIRYSPVKEQKKKVVHTAMSSENDKITMVPLKIIFDYHFARWYVLGMPLDAKPGEELHRYRIDYISHISPGKPVPDDKLVELREQCEHELEHSWCITYTPNLTKVKVLFKFDQIADQENFIKKRVKEQGQWGKILEEYEDGSFLWEITVRGFSEITPWIRSFGRGAVVLEPKEFKEKMKDDWKAVLSQYEPCE